jgi:hydrogenase maturation protein HypF
VNSLPYDRPNTTMGDFAMCARCRAEYEDGGDRRFHAQPIACPECGPRLRLLDPGAGEIATGHEALLLAAEAVRRGRIVALKGLGGFQLLADARDGQAVAELRRRKRRPDKPFAVMMPSLDAARAYCRIGALERGLLTSAEAPITLLRRRPVPRDGLPELAPSVAPANPLLGVMLPYTPLHHLLLRELGFAVVATSGNLSDEPIATDEDEALSRLGAIADLFLSHDRPIARPLDDSVVRTMAGRPLVLRRARGYAPFPMALKGPARRLLALGGHLKAAPAVAVGSRIIVGPHVGDLETAPARRAFDSSVRDLTGMYAVRPEAVVCDAHPDYHTTRVAGRSGARVIAVQHHLAHVAACMAENGIAGDRALGVAWDGTGYGEDGTIWGGEFLRIDGARARRIGHFLPFALPGGEKAAREPRRAALGLLHEVLGEAALAEESLAPVGSFSPQERKILSRMLAGGMNTPRTSSVGRLFDAVASLMGLLHRTSFEGQAAMALEFAAGRGRGERRYGLGIEPAPGAGPGPFVLDWRPMVRGLLIDLKDGVPSAVISGAFHEALIEAILAIALRAGESRVVLTGGCFQNRLLTEGAVARLRGAGFDPVWHRHVPPNDGGLALGQAAWAARILERGEA